MRGKAAGLPDSRRTSASPAHLKRKGKPHPTIDGTQTAIQTA
jgi:hypothetical protein